MSDQREQIAALAARVIERFDAAGPRTVHAEALTFDCYQAFEPGADGEAILIQYARETNELRVNVGTLSGILVLIDPAGRLCTASWGPSSATVTEALDALAGVGPELTDDDRHCLKTIAVLTEEMGHPPSAHQVRKRLQSRSTSAIAHQMQRLTRAGYITDSSRNLRRPVEIIAHP